MANQIAEKRSKDSARTRKKILKSASNLFIKRGFDGVSMSEIAKEAKINQSLIYHYFASKEELWKSVKTLFVETFVKGEDLVFDTTLGLRHILHQIVHARFTFYYDHPEIMRMIGWQKLEAKSEKLAGGTFFSPDNWKKVFSELQQLGEVRPKIDLDLMILFISSAITGAFTEDYQKKLNNQESKNAYLDMLIDCFMLSFGKS